ncbi:AMP-binding protein [Agrobacterium arsenijevicii]|uniref:AMP-binding protein n=1 Tax=Agrobacterium arsenijevicii TaxID=1585697 RepID=A0ABR5D028_9HYPH|nr:AMP-binding protein [Agrobacterium arsenijevicii]
MLDAADRGSQPAYESVYAQFSVEAEVERLSGDLTNGINACIECCDRHVGANRVALRCLAQDSTYTEYTFEQLQELSARTANFLASHGVEPGDVVAGLLPRTVDVVATILGAWRLGAVYQPLFTAFGPKAIDHRLAMSGAKLIVTNTVNRVKLDDLAYRPKIAVVLKPGDVRAKGDLDFLTEIYSALPRFSPILRGGDDLFLMMSTSGTTGLSKGVPVPLRALLAFSVYMRFAVDLRDDDVFWNLADPGWAYGLYYGITGPLLLGHATIFNEAGFTAESTYDVIDKLGVTSLAGSPTAFRMLLAAGPKAAEVVTGRLRRVSSAGEPLNPEVIRAFDVHLAAPIYDHYGQTELGMVVNNHHGLDHVVHHGSAGFPMPGYSVAVLDDEGRDVGINEPGCLAIDVKNSPLLWFYGYLNEESPSIRDGYYRTGDTVEREPDGTISFVGRSDDVITSSGYRIGPFDVESALVEHPAVVEAAVVGVPDPERTEIVKAFVVLASDVVPSDELAQELAQHVKRRLAAHSYPRAVDFVDELPKTPSGKIQRFILRKAEIEKLQQQESGQA